MSWKWAIWGLLPINSCRVGPADLSIKTCTNVLWGGKKYITDSLSGCLSSPHVHPARIWKIVHNIIFLNMEAFGFDFPGVYLLGYQRVIQNNGLHACGHGCFVSKQSLEHCWTCWWVIPYPSRRAAARWSERVEGIRFPWMCKDEAGTTCGW